MGLKVKLYRFIELYGKDGLFLLIFYPIVITPMTLYALLRSLMNVISALIKEPWDTLTGNTPNSSLNNYFYKVQDLNLKRFGRYGQSNYVAGGNNFSLKNWFQTMPVALRIQSKIGVVAMLFIAMIIWTGSWFFIMEPTVMNFAILFLAISSTYFFANFIDGQNYNVLAWMLLPLILHALFKQDYVVYGSLLFLISFFSFTAIFISGVITAIFSLYLLDPYLLISAIPAGIKAVIPISFALLQGAPKKMGGAIGIHDDVKYRRPSRRTSASLIYAAFFCYLSVFPALYYYFYDIDNFLILQCIIIALFFCNIFVSRFADAQTFYILLLSAFTFSMIGKEFNLFMLSCFFLTINPAYFIIGYRPLKNPVSPPARPPVNTAPFIKNIQNLTKHIKQDERVLFLFKNPQNMYSKVFDGYRVIIEPILYQFQKARIQIFPDWFYLYEFNKISDTDLIWWNNDVKLLNASINHFNVDYILTYETLLENFDVPFLSEIERIYIDEAKTYFILYKVAPPRKRK